MGKFSTYRKRGNSRDRYPLPAPTAAQIVQTAVSVEQWAELVVAFPAGANAYRVKGVETTTGTVKTSTWLSDLQNRKRLDWGDSETVDTFAQWGFEGASQDAVSDWGAGPRLTFEL